MSGSFFGRVTVDSTNSGITVDGGATALDSGSYYLYHPTAALSLLDELVGTIEAESGYETSYSISSDGVVTLTSATAIVISAWEGHDLFGFSSTGYGSSTSFVAEKSLPYCWFPNVDPHDSAAPTSRPAAPSVLSSQSLSLDGDTVYTSKFGEDNKQFLAYQNLTLAKTWQATSADNSSLEEFYVSTLDEGRQFVYFPDWPVATPVHAYKHDLRNEQKMDVKRQLRGSDTYWLARLSLISVD